MSEIENKRKIEQLEREIADLKGEMGRVPLRFEPPLPSAGREIRDAYPTEDAPDESTIINCRLDDPDTGEEVEVHCIVMAATTLAECVPELKEGVDGHIQVCKIDGEWWCVSDIFVGNVP